MFMKAFFQFCCLSLILAASTIGLHAQSHPQLIIANGGVFGPANKVTVAAWDLLTKQYTVFDTFPASSVQHVLVDGRRAYVCADSFVVSYDLDQHLRLTSVIVHGVRQSAITTHGTLCR